MKNIGPLLLDYLGMAIEYWKPIAAVLVVALVIYAIW